MTVALFKRDFKIAFYSLKETLFVTSFLLFCGALFPFVLGPEADTLARYGPGIMWILTFFSISLNLNTFFHQDAEDGSLDQLLISTQSPSFLFFVRASTHTLFMGSSLLVANAVLGILFHLSSSLFLWVLISLLISLPSLVFISGLIALLTLEVPFSPFIRPIILFPFYLPPLIFGVNIVENVLLSQSPFSCLKILTAISLLYVWGSTALAGKILFYRHS